MLYSPGLRFAVVARVLTKLLQSTTIRVYTMAKTTGQAEQPAGPAVTGEAKKEGGLPLKKLLMFGVPVFVVQLVVVYFVMTRFASPAPCRGDRPACSRGERIPRSGERIR